MKLVDDTSSGPDRDEQAASWCLDFAEGVLSPDEQRTFDQWYAVPANASAFQRAADTWDTVELLAGAPEIVQLRSDALDAYRRGTLRRGSIPVRWSKAAWAACVPIAAAIALIIGWSASPAKYDFRTGIGERRVAMLEDGSRLSLDADSEVAARFSRDRRALILKRGRARFDVAHEPLRPFTVTVGDKLVVATGTSFSVERLESAAHVALFEGHVAVLDAIGKPVPLTGSAEGADTALTPGGDLTLPITSNGPAVLTRLGVDGASRWQRGQLSFDDTALPLAVERMNRYLREPLVVGDAAAGRVRVTGVFSGGDATGFIAALRQLNGVRAERRSGKVVLTGR